MGVCTQFARRGSHSNTLRRLHENAWILILLYGLSRRDPAFSEAPSAEPRPKVIKYLYENTCAPSTSKGIDRCLALWVSYFNSRSAGHEEKTGSTSGFSQAFPQLKEASPAPPLHARALHIKAACKFSPN